MEKCASPAVAQCRRTPFGKANTINDGTKAMIYIVSVDKFGRAT